MTFTDVTVNSVESTYARGGFIYSANNNLDIIATNVNIYDSYAKTNTGGVFLFHYIKTVTLTTCVFERFSPGGYGTFMFSQANNLRLTIDTCIIKCYSAAPTYATHI